MADSLSPVSAYGEFFIQYGQFLAAWNSFEVLVEVAIMRELRLTVQESRILNGALGFGAKSGILRALLVRTDEGKAKSAVITSATTLAERNSFAHGFISLSSDKKSFTLVRREVKGLLDVRSKKFTSLTMQKHCFQFVAECVKAQTMFGVTDSDLIRYQREVESLEQARQVQRSNHQRSATSSGLTKRERRRAQRAQTQLHENDG